MTEEHEKHLKSIVKSSNDRLITKYFNGQREHGGKLWEMPIDKLVSNALDEVVDLIAYLETLKQRLEESYGDIQTKSEQRDNGNNAEEGSLRGVDKTSVPKSSKTIKTSNASIQVKE